MTALLLIAATMLAQSSTQEESYRPYTESPRLFLRSQRLRLLKRENERKSIRWQHYNTLIAGKARMDEPGFAYALHAIVTGDAGSTKTAIDWALAANNQPRQVALVYDWCRPSLSPAQAKALEAKLIRAAQATSASVPAVRDRVLAAVAVADADPAGSERTLKAVVVEWWRNGLAKQLESGKTTIGREDIYPFYEILHAIRDNLSIELREDATDFFKPLPGNFLLGHYPAPLPEPENEYRLPAYPGPGEPDLKMAALSRAAGLSMVAYDNNATDSQFLQGWLLMDKFILRGTFGIPYEFLWANPYQPGLSYYHFPLFHHDPRSGRLFVRSSWDDNAMWFGIVGGQMQLFNEGKITLMNPKLKQPALELAAQRIFVGTTPVRFDISTEEAGTAFVVGLAPNTRYNIEVDDEELTDGLSDPAGTLSLPLSAGMKAGVRITEAARSGGKLP